MNRWIALPVCLASATALAQPRRPSPFDSPRPIPVKLGETPGYSGLGAESISPEDIARFAAPALAPEVSRRIQAMLDIRGSGNGVITSKGDRMYFTSAVTGSPHVWRQDGPMKFPVQLTGGEDRTVVAGDRARRLVRGGQPGCRRSGEPWALPARPERRARSASSSTRRGCRPRCSTSRTTARRCTSAPTTSIRRRTRSIATT